MYRKTPSFALAEVRQIAFLADRVQHVIGCGSGQRLPGVKDPHTVFFTQWTCAAHRAKRDSLTGTFHLQGVARLQMQFFPKWLWYYDATSFINNESDCHFGKILWVKPPTAAILTHNEASLHIRRKHGVSFERPRMSSPTRTTHRTSFDSICAPSEFLPRPRLNLRLVENTAKGTHRDLVMPRHDHSVQSPCRRACKLYVTAFLADFDKSCGLTSALAL
jgi:hypothetical protein